MQTRSFARFWLLSGVGALGVGGAYALLLGAGRSSSSPLIARLFHDALVVHVDLLVLGWFLSIACMFWSLAAPKSDMTERAALISFDLGMALMALSPLDAKAEALMSNYIPVITSPVFFLGLSLLMCGVGLQLARYFAYGEREWTVQAFARYSAGVIALIALLAFAWSYARMPGVIDGQQYYELLFWGGGHVLQLVHGQFVILAWALLVVALAPGVKPRGMVLAALMIACVAAACAPVIYLAHDIASMEFRQAFTWVVMAFGGLGPALALLWALRRISMPSAKEKALFTSLLMSLLLFGYGGVLAMMIHGQNVIIPAHYHGSIVGLTIAFCGVAYLYLPRFGYGDVAGTKLATWQPVVLGLGQALHITGLAWSGGYGALRKTPGAVGGFEHAQAAMALIGGGSGLATIGGLMFVVAVYRSVRRPNSSLPPSGNY